MVGSIIEFGIHRKVHTSSLVIEPPNLDFVCCIHQEVVSSGVVQFNLAKVIVIRNIIVIGINWFELISKANLSDLQADICRTGLSIVGAVSFEVEIISVLVSFVVEDLTVIIQESSLGFAISIMCIFVLLLEGWVDMQVKWVLSYLISIVV